MPPNVYFLDKDIFELSQSPHDSVDMLGVATFRGESANCVSFHSKGMLPDEGEDTALSRKAPVECNPLFDSTVMARNHENQPRLRTQK